MQFNVIVDLFALIRSCPIHKIKKGQDFFVYVSLFVLRPRRFLCHQIAYWKSFYDGNFHKTFRFWIFSLNFIAVYFIFRLIKDWKLNWSNSELLLVAVTQNLNKFFVYCSDLCLQFVTKIRVAVGNFNLLENELKTLHKFRAFAHSFLVFLQNCFETFQLHKHMNLSRLKRKCN